MVNRILDGLGEFTSLLIFLLMVPLLPVTWWGIWWMMTWLGF